MTLDVLFVHSVEAYQEILQSNRPADALLSNYFRNRKYLGAHDRKFIAETVFGALRKHLWLSALSEKFLAEQGLPQKFHAAFILVFFFLNNARLSRHRCLRLCKNVMPFRERHWSAL
ncbi:MAG: hypothetical protein ACK42Y_08455 [Candidatus Thermochlorobacter sp.]